MCDEIVIAFDLTVRACDASAIKIYSAKIEPRHEKTCPWGFRPGKTQTGLCSHRS